MMTIATLSPELACWTFTPEVLCSGHLEVRS